MMREPPRNKGEGGLVSNVKGVSKGLSSQWLAQTDDWRELLNNTVFQAIEQSSEGVNSCAIFVLSQWPHIFKRCWFRNYLICHRAHICCPTRWQYNYNWRLILLMSRQLVIHLALIFWVNWTQQIAYVLGLSFCNFVWIRVVSLY